MRELERDHTKATPLTPPALPEPLAIVGAGRAGNSIARAAADAGLDVRLGGRGFDPEDAAIILLCVPDEAIREACENVADRLAPSALVGHASGAGSLDLLDAARSGEHGTFSLHPLQTIPGPDTDLAGASAAISGSSADTLGTARVLAERLGLRPFEVPADGRAAYHAAASMASNFLVALEESAAALMARAGVDAPREALAPLVMRTAANWVDAGPSALTGPIARGDLGTVERHRQALRERAPELEALYEVLAERTRALGAAA